jgi:hypothetical protein
MNSTSLVLIQNTQSTERLMAQRKIICRYGRGCTHLNDLIHRDRFWHPMSAIVNGIIVLLLLLLLLYIFIKRNISFTIFLFIDEQLVTHYICNECGLASTSLLDLQVSVILYSLRKYALMCMKCIIAASPKKNCVVE